VAIDQHSPPPAVTSCGLASGSGRGAFHLPRRPSDFGSGAVASTFAPTLTNPAGARCGVVFIHADSGRPRELHHHATENPAVAGTWPRFEVGPVRRGLGPAPRVRVSVFPLVCTDSEGPSSPAAGKDRPLCRARLRADLRRFCEAGVQSTRDPSPGLQSDVEAFAQGPKALPAPPGNAAGPRPQRTATTTNATASMPEL